MAGPSGFVTRSKGKSTFQGLWAQGSAFWGSGSVQSYSTDGTQTMGLEGVSRISASSGASVFQMSDIVFPGLRKIIDVVAVSSSVFIKAPTGVAFDVSTNTVIKSTYVQRLSFIGISSVAMRLTDVYPDTTAGGAPVGGVTLSTTT